MLEAGLVALGGALGATLRWFLGIVLKNFAGDFPLATLTANLLAAVAIGFIVVAARTTILNEHLRLLLAVGLCGGLSTLSSFLTDTFTLFEKGNYDLALINIGCNLFLTFLAVGVSMHIAERLFASA